MDKRYDTLKLLLLNNNLSKSEVIVLEFCFYQKRTSLEISEYMGWKKPNVSRLTISLVNKGYLLRELKEDRSYLYYTNKDCDLFK